MHVFFTQVQKTFSLNYLCDICIRMVYSFLFAPRELGVHVDGFIAVTGHTIVVGTTKVNLRSKVKSVPALLNCLTMCSSAN